MTKTTKQPVSSITIISHGCLSFDLMFPSYVKTANEDEDWIDDPDELGAYRFEGTDELEADALTEWVKKHMTIQFDGGLDDPNAFESIKVVKMYGPDACEYSDEGLIVSGACFYLEVGTKQEINEDQLEDIFHIIIPTIELNGSQMGFTQFENYTGTFEDAPDEGKDLSVVWEK